MDKVPFSGVPTTETANMLVSDVALPVIVAWSILAAEASMMYGDGSGQRCSRNIVERMNEDIGASRLARLMTAMLLHVKGKG